MTTPQVPAIAQGFPGQMVPPAPQGEERTTDAPKPQETDGNSNQPATQPSKEFQDAFLDIEKRYREQWLPVRRKRIRQILRAFEYLRGSQYISFDPDQFLWFDPLEAVFDGNTEDEDLGIYRYVTNIYQMLWFSFLAALSAETPKSRFMPNNAKMEIDVATATAGSTLMEIIEKKNKIKKMQRAELTHFWTGGAYFKYTRFIVDKAKFQTHREPQYQMQEQEIFPDRYTCPACDHDTPAAAAQFLSQPICEACGAPLGPQNFFPAEKTPPIPTVTGFKDVPNGMVAQSCYGHLNAVIAPYAAGPQLSPGIFLDEEVDIASVRTSYPDAWNAVKGSTTGEVNNDGEAERAARQVVNNAVGGRNNMTTGLMPTLTRSWLHHWAFAILDDKALVEKLQAEYPDGVMFVHVGDTFLEARKEDMDQKWTWAATSDEFGAFPPPVGEAALDLQDQYNDTSNIIMESDDRTASPETYMDESMFDVRALANKRRLPGSIVGIKRKLEEMNRPLADFIHTPRVAVNTEIYQRPLQLFETAQLLTGVMPQVFGGGTQEGVDTLGGQRQALNQALTRLHLFWESMREEHASAAELAVRCGAKNFQDDVMNVIGGGSDQYTNQYVRLSDLGGEFHATVDTDQGFPATWAEIRDRVQEMFLHAKDNPWAAAMLDNPVNARMVAMLIGPPDMVIPGDATRSKTLRVIDRLLEQKPNMQMGQGPMGPVPVTLPSILPDKDFDDLDIAVKVCKQWGQENWELQYENQDGYENVRAYKRMCEELGAAVAQKEALMNPAPAEEAAPAGGGA